MRVCVYLLDILIFEMHIQVCGWLHVEFSFNADKFIQMNSDDHKKSIKSK